MKRSLMYLVCGLMVAATPAIFSACKTDESGVKSSYHSQWTTVNGDTMRVTKAAREVVEDLHLQNVDSKSTGVDGLVTARTADKTRITIEVQRVTDTTSQVSVNVGTLGDPALGKDILARIQNKLK
jgi:pantothenate kinase